MVMAIKLTLGVDELDCVGDASRKPDLGVPCVQTIAEGRCIHNEHVM